MINQNLFRKLDLTKLRKIKKKNKDLNHYRSINNISHSNSYHKNKINKLEEKQKKIDEELNIISQENSQFLDSYNKIRKKYPIKIEESFKDVIKMYNEKGYKTPNFSPSHSLFTQNPLLMPNNKINDYFMIHSKKTKSPNFYSAFQKKNKHLSFLEKEEEIINEQFKKLRTLKNNDSQKNLNKTQQYNKPHFLTLIKDSVKNIQLKEENEKIKAYNEKIEHIIPSLRIRPTTYKPKKIKLLPSKSKIKFSTFKSSVLDETDFTTRRNNKREKTYIESNKKNNKYNSKFLIFQKNKVQNLKKKSILNKFDNFITSLNNKSEQENFLNELKNIDLTLLNRKDLEKIALTYCKQFLKYSDIALNELTNPKCSDFDLMRLINDFIFKLDCKNIMDLSNDNSVNGKIIDLNNNVRILKNRFAIFAANKS